MLDASGSIQSEADFKLCIEFIKGVYHAFGMGGGIRFAFVIFGSSAQVIFDFSKYSSISEVDSALGQVGSLFKVQSSSNLSEYFYLTILCKEETHVTEQQFRLLCGGYVHRRQAQKRPALRSLDSKFR